MSTVAIRCDYTPETKAMCALTGYVMHDMEVVISVVIMEKKEGTMVVLKVGCRRWWDLHLEFKLSVSLSASDGDPSSGTREEQFPAC
jgi:hypothetical protein